MPGVIEILLIAAVAAACVLLLLEKRRNSELEDNLKDTEEALSVLRNIKHQQNNMFQSIIFYLEGEQWEEAREFINEIMAKTGEFNKNNLLQLIKIKNYKLRNTLSRIISVCAKRGTNLEVIVTWEADFSSLKVKAACRLLTVCFANIAVQVSESRDKQVTIEICSDNEGFSAVISNTFDEEATGINAVKRLNSLSKNCIFNSYIDNNCFKQEIMVTKK